MYFLGLTWLQAKVLGLTTGRGSDVRATTSFLSKALDPPHLLAIKNAIHLLQVISHLILLDNLKT